MRRTKGERRHRNVAHLWADKRVFRFLRHSYEKGEFKHLRSVYFALCEIDSDFGEGIQIKGFTKTVAAYCGLGITPVGKCLQTLRNLNLIDYRQKIVNGKFCSTVLEMFEWSDPNDVEDKSRYPEVTQTWNHAHVKSGYNKNNTNVLTTNKNDSKESSKNTHFGFITVLNGFPEGWRENKSFRKALHQFIIHRKQMGQPPTPMSVTKFTNKLSKYDISIAIEALNKSIENSWRGVFPESIKSYDQHSSNSSQSSQVSPEEILHAHFKRHTDKWVDECLVPAMKLTHANNGDGNTIAANICKLADWYTSNQHLPEFEEVPKMYSFEAATYSRLYHIPDAHGLISKFVIWLQDQQWIEDISPRHFTPTSGVFQKFFKNYQREENIDFFTARSYV